MALDQFREYYVQEKKVEERPFRAVFSGTNIQGFSPGAKDLVVYILKLL